MSTADPQHPRRTDDPRDPGPGLGETRRVGGNDHITDTGHDRRRTAGRGEVVERQKEAYGRGRGWERHANFRTYLWDLRHA